MYQLVSCADQIDPPKEALRWTVTVGMTVGALARRPGMSIEKHTRRITGEAQVEAQTKKQATRSSEAPSLGRLGEELWGEPSARGLCAHSAGRKAERGPRRRTSIHINRVELSGIGSTDGSDAMVSDSCVLLGSRL